MSAWAKLHQRSTDIMPGKISRPFESIISYNAKLNWAQEEQRRHLHSPWFHFSWLPPMVKNVKSEKYTLIHQQCASKSLKLAL